MTHLMIGMDALDSLGGVQSVIRILAGAFDDDGDRVELVEIEPANPRATVSRSRPRAQYASVESQVSTRSRSSRAASVLIV